MATAWVLLWMFGTNHVVSVSNIASENECHDLAKRLQSEYYLEKRYKCVRYVIAH